MSACGGFYDLVPQAAPPAGTVREQKPAAKGVPGVVVILLVVMLIAALVFGFKANKDRQALEEELTRYKDAVHVETFEPSEGDDTEPTESTQETMDPTEGEDETQPTGEEDEEALVSDEEAESDDEETEREEETTPGGNKVKSEGEE